MNSAYQRPSDDATVGNAFELVKSHMLEDCWDRMGPEYGNEGMMTIRWGHQNVDRWLKNLNPEVALILFGTNDLSGLEVQEYEAKTRPMVQECVDNGTVVILSTAPPRHGLAEKAAVFAEAVRKIARELKVPLTDYHGEILKRRPDDFLMFFLFDLDIQDNCRYPIPHPTTGKWATHTMKVTRGGPLKAGHKVDDVFFFAGPPGSKTTRLMVDNVRLEGSDE